MGAKSRVVRGFVMTETGIPYQLKGQVPGILVQDAAVGFPNPVNQFLELAVDIFLKMKPFNDYLNQALAGFKMPER